MNQINIHFKDPRYIQSSRDAAEFVYPFDIKYRVNEGLISEEEIIEHKKIKVGISGTLAIIIGYDVYDNEGLLQLKKILFEYGKRLITQKIKDGTLNDYEELILLTDTHSGKLPFDINEIPEPKGYSFNIDIPEKRLQEKMKEDLLATSIIQYRDNINVLFYHKYGEKLFLINQESNITDLYREVTSRQEFTHSLASLVQYCTTLNVNTLRKIIPDTENENKSINLLEKYLELIKCNYTKIIEYLRQVNRLRQGYPIHTDIANSVVESHRFFNFNYPILDFQSSWNVLLEKYLELLKGLYDIFNAEFLKK